MIEQETASIIAFILAHAGPAHPYYHEVPQDFIYPAVYFPVPEIETRGETLSAYAAEFVWFINFFDKTTQGAYALAYGALQAIKQYRNLIPLTDEAGIPAKEGVRIKDPIQKTVESGVVQLQIGWISRRPYNRDEAEKAFEFIINIGDKEHLSD